MIFRDVIFLEIRVNSFLKTFTNSGFVVSNFMFFDDVIVSKIYTTNK